MATFHNSWFRNSALRPWTRKLKPLQDTPINWCEIGCFQGQSADWALNNVLLHPHSHMWVIDPWISTRKLSPADMEKNYQLALSNLEPHIKAGRVTIYRETSQERLPKMPDNLFDVLYVDGDHTYDGVKFDCEVGWKKLRPGGILLVDDYRPWRKMDGVTRYVNETFFGVSPEGVESEPPVKAELFFESSKQLAFYKPTTEGDNHVATCSGYASKHLHPTRATGPFLRPGSTDAPGPGKG